MGNNWNSAPPLSNPPDQPTVFGEYNWFKKILALICEYCRHGYMNTSTNHALLAIITLLLVFIVCREVCRCRKSSKGRPIITVSQVNQQSLDRATDGRLQDPTSKRDPDTAHSTTQTNLNLTNVIKSTSIGDLTSFIKNLSASLANNAQSRNAIQVFTAAESKPEPFRPEQSDVDNWCKRFVSYVKSNSITDKVETLIASIDKVSAKHLTNLAGDRTDEETFDNCLNMFKKLHKSVSKSIAEALKAFDNRKAGSTPPSDANSVYLSSMFSAWD